MGRSRRVGRVDHRQEINVCPIQWDAHAIKHLEGVGGCSAEFYRQLQETENVTFYAVLENLCRVATVVLRLEDHGNHHTEAVLVAAGGKARSNLTLLALPLFERIARLSGARSFRLHTERPGLIRKLAARAGEHELSVRWELA